MNPTIEVLVDGTWVELAGDHPDAVDFFQDHAHPQWQCRYAVSFASVEAAEVDGWLPSPDVTALINEYLAVRERSLGTVALPPASAPRPVRAFAIGAGV